MGADLAVLRNNLEALERVSSCIQWGSRFSCF